MKLEKSQWVLMVLSVLFVTFTLAFFIGRNSISAVITTQNPQPTPAQTSTAKQDEAPVQEAATIIEQPRVNLNTATQEELEDLPGIGPKLAERIIAWREQNGAFVSVEQLMDVSGIAEGKFADIQDFVYVEEKK